MYCPKCGAEIPAGYRYCPGCDAHVDTANLPVRKIGFGEAVRNFFTQYATFSGRATRSEYWYVVLFSWIVSIAISVIGGLISSELTTVLGSLYSLAILVPSFAVVWRRLHDIGKSGGWYFIGLIPLVGWIILLVFFCTGSDGDNRFGPRKV